MRAAEIYYEKYTSLTGLDQDDFTQVLNEARKEALSEAANVVKTYKVGNSGSWFDAAVDKSTILNLIKELK